MKKIQAVFLALALAIAFASPASAQNFHYGVKAGTNLAVQSGIAEYYDNNNIRIGMNAGLVGDYHFKNNMMLQAELDYDQKGSHSSQVDTRYNYVSIPVLFDYSFGHADHSKLSFHLNIGPYVAFLTKAKKMETIKGVKYTTNLFDASHKAVFGGLIGFGFRQPVGNHSLFWDIRLTIGITHFDKADSESRNKMISVSMGYTL